MMDDNIQGAACSWLNQVWKCGVTFQCWLWALDCASHRTLRDISAAQLSGAVMPLLQDTGGASSSANNHWSQVHVHADG